MASLKEAIYDLLVSSKYHQALRNCQEYELQIQEEIVFNDGNVNSLPRGCDFYGWYMICLLFLENLNEAKYLWKRLPAEVKSSNSAIVKLWDIGCFLWGNEANKAFNEINSYNWSAEMQPLIHRLKINIFASLAKSFGKIFPSLSTLKLSQLLHIGHEDITQLCTAAEFAINSDGSITIPSEYPSDFIQQQALKFSQDGNVVKDLANYVSALEQEPLKVDLSNKKSTSSAKK